MNVEQAKGLLKGVIIGAGLSWAARTLVPTLRPVVRPVAKGVTRTVLTGLQRSRESTAVMAESISDLVAEVKWEMDQEQGSAATRPETSEKIPVNPTNGAAQEGGG